jgi:hypothetical protein
MRALSNAGKSRQIWLLLRMGARVCQLSNHGGVCYDKMGRQRGPGCDESGFFRDRITEPQCGRACLKSDMSTRPGPLRRLLRWMRHAAARPRPAQFTIIPDPQVLAIWRALLRADPKERD